jgi:hypothetical protein
MADLPFMDALHKRHGKALGFFSTQQFAGYIEMGAVLVAEEVDSCELVVGSGEQRSSLPTTNYQLPTSSSPLGYIISRDRYLKRDELGVIFQLCVVPGRQRKLVGASLVAEAFRRSAYGCRLYCLWCAKDLEANYFWESLGFVPIAFRAGSDRKRRVHIFWQKRIVEGDGGQGGTKWWYPAKTEGGAIRADRLVFPIPPGTRWQDVEAVNLPGQEETPKLEGPRTPRVKRAGKAAVKAQAGPVKVGPLCGGLMFAPPTPVSSEPVVVEAEKKPKQGREKKPKAKIDPKLVAAARELRDRWLEHVNAGAYLIEDAGKYDVSRALAGPAMGAHLPDSPARLLPAAA